MNTPASHAARPSRSGCLWPLVVLALGLAALALTAWWLLTSGGLANLKRLGTPTQQFTFAGPTVNQVQSLALLTVQSVQVVSELEAEAAFRKGVWIVRGSADYAVDFAKAETLDRDELAKKLSIRLPLPQLRNARLDEQRTRLVTYEKTGLGWWTIGMAGSRDEFESTSRARMNQAITIAAQDEQFMALAKQSAERLVRGMFDLTGWSVQIEWHAGP